MKWSDINYNQQDRIVAEASRAPGAICVGMFSDDPNNKPYGIVDFYLTEQERLNSWLKNGYEVIPIPGHLLK